VEDRSTAALVDRLFVPQERWGWEYVEPARIERNPHADHQPIWYEPATPETQKWERNRAKAVRQVPLRLVIVVVAAILAFLFSQWLGYTVLLVGLLAAFAPVMVPAQRIKQAKTNAAEQREELAKQFQQAHAQWQANSFHFEREQTRQRESAPVWYPLKPHTGVSRVDVFGGTADGWASLLATLGSSLLQSGNGILVLDFTEQDIAGDLAEFAFQRRFSVKELDLPEDAERAQLLSGLEPTDIAEVLAESIHTMRKGNEGIDLRALDAELLAAVLERLESPPTFTRLVAGIKVLRRIHDVYADNEVLSVSEVRNLTTHIDIVGQSERVQQELQFLTSVLDLLAKQESATTTEVNADSPTNISTGIWPTQGLAVLTTNTSHQRRKDFIDRVLLHRVLHELRTYRRRNSDSVLIVAGADHIGMESLEAMARQARRSGIRLVLMLEHLREELQQLLGSSDSAAILMRLGNAKEATAAAEFIGRGYKFILNQITKSIGSTFTEGDSQSISDGDSISYTTGTNVGTSRNKGFGRQSRSRSKSDGTSESTATSRSKTWQASVNKSTADSTTDGTTLSRVYEFSIEPTQLQGLPPTAYILVEPGPSGRRVVVGDCNPGISLLNRVSHTPRRL
jgi:hypothetical protein